MKLLLAVAALLLVGAQCLTPQRFIADDAYFYLVTARNLALHGEHSFSGFVPTNGVHPLWLYLVTAWSWLVGLQHPAWLWNPRTCIPLELACLLVGTRGAARVAQQLAVPWLPVVALSLCFLLAFGLLHTEAALLFAALSWTLALWLQPHPTSRQALLLGLGSALTVLARLDTIFVIVALHGAFWLRPGPTRRKTQATLTAALPVAAYAMANHLAFGTFMPVSGLRKSTFPAVCVDGWQSAGVASAVSGYSLLFGWLPLLLTVVALWQVRRSAPRAAGLLAALAIGVAVHATYIALFTQHNGSWLWYCVAPVLMAAIAGTVVGTVALRPRLLTGAVVVVIAASLAFAARASLRDQPRGEAQTVLDWLATAHIDHTTLLVSDAAGEIAFRSHNRVIGLDLLTTHPQFAQTVLDAPAPLDALLVQTRALGAPTAYIVLTTNTFLSALQPTADFQTLTLSLRHPGQCASLALPPGPGTHVGPPLVRLPGLAVWQVAARAR